jgi:hypothetical protein
MTCRRWIPALLCACAIAGVSAAQQRPGPNWETPMGGTRTAVDAAQRVFPGSSFDGGTLVLTRDRQLRMPGTSSRRAVLPSGTRLEAPVALSVRAQGRRFTLLMWDGTRPDASDDGGFGEQVSVIGVFPDGSVEPTDVAEVRQDRETYLSGGGPSLAGDDGFTVTNTHLNAGEEYVDAGFFHLRDGRLRRIVEFSTVSMIGRCAKAFTQSARVTTAPAAGRDYPDVVASVELVRAPASALADCEGPHPRETRERYQDTYRWDTTALKYVRVGGTIDRLDAWTRKQILEN